MNRLLRLAPVAFVVSAGLASAQGQSQALIKQTFKDSDGGWTVFGQSAKISVSHEAPVVDAGAAALKLDYRVAKGDFNAMVLPTPIGSIAKAKSLKFRVHTDATTLVAVMLQEQDGGRYVTTFLAPKDKWQSVELSIADFGLSQDKGDPKDPDGKLDMDQINGIAICDVGQMFAQTDDPNLRSLFDLKPGGHALYIEEFSVITDGLPADATSAAGEIRLETFVHPQLAWFSIGQAQLSQSEGSPLAGSGLRADYHQAGKPMALMRMIVPGLLTGAKTMTFDIASKMPTHLAVQVEDVDGGKYNAIIDVPGGSEVQHMKLNFADFKVADDSKVKDGKLDVAKVKTLMFFDPTGIQYQTDHENTLWIGELRATS